MNTRFVAMVAMVNNGSMRNWFDFLLFDTLMKPDNHLSSLNDDANDPMTKHSNQIRSTFINHV